MIISMIFVIMSLGSITTHNINQNSKTDRRFSHSTLLNKSNNLLKRLAPKIKRRQLNGTLIGKHVEKLSALPYFSERLCNRIKDLPSSSQKNIKNQIFRVVEKEEIISSKIEKRKHMSEVNLQRRDSGHFILIKVPDVKQKQPRDLCSVLWRSVKKMSPSSQRRIKIILLQLVEEEEKLTESYEESDEFQTEYDLETDEEFLTTTPQNRKHKAVTKRPLPQSLNTEEVSDFTETLQTADTEPATTVGYVNVEYTEATKNDNKYIENSLSQSNTEPEYKDNIITNGYL